MSNVQYTVYVRAGYDVTIYDWTMDNHGRLYNRAKYSHLAQNSLTNSNKKYKKNK